MKKYFFNDGNSQQGPFTLEELGTKNITTQTPVWYDGLPDWTTAGQVEELKEILIHTPPPFHPVATVPAATVTTTPAPASTAMAASASTPSGTKRKSTAWLSYVLGLLVLGGIGYYVYLDMEKNKGNSKGTTQLPSVSDSTANTEVHSLTTEPVSETKNTEEEKEESTTNTETTSPVTTVTTESKENAPPAVNTKKTEKATLTPATAKPNTLTKTQQETQKPALKKAEEEKKKLLAAQAEAAKEMEYRNNWPKYITFGNLDYGKGNDGVDAFNVPVYNGTNAMLDKVTVRVDYMKKEKKVLSSETVTIYNIPPGAGLNGKALGSKKGNNVKVFITGITSRKLHFCFPSNNGNPSDPYFCN